MEFASSQIPSSKISPHIHWGHFGTIMGAVVLLVGMSWFSKPELFSLKNNSAEAANTNAPHYYAYVQPSDDTVPLVAGASTNQGPSVINEDGTVSPIDMGQVLGASTQDVQLSTGQIKVSVMADSPDSIQKFLSDAQAIENGPIDNSNFEAALSSGDQSQINIQAQKLVGIRDALQKLSVPQGLAQWDKLNIIQYNAAIGVLQNFTNADQNPQLVGDYLNQFLKSQQALESEATSVASKYSIDPNLLGVAQDEAVIQTMGQATIAAAAAAVPATTPATNTPIQTLNVR